MILCQASWKWETKGGGCLESPRAAMCVHGAGVCSAGRMQSRNLGSLSGARGSSGVLPGEAEWQSGLMASPS